MTREEAIKIIKEFINETCLHLVDQEALKTLIPELVESEDERIRNCLRCLTSLDQAQDVIEDMGFTRQDLLAYLEKQKEQRLLSIGAASEWLRNHICNYVNSEYNEFHKCVEYDGSIDKERLINDFEEAMQKEQKPDDDPLDNPKFLKGFDTGRDVQRIFDEQKPAEWSEEDKKLIDNVVNSLCCYQNTLSDYQKEIVGEEIRKLKSLKPLSKQEWSEEDEHRRKDAIYFLESAMRHYADTSEIEKTIDWLKSLRPKSHWKPSEEQMEALKDEIKYCYACGMHERGRKLQSLYDNLYKLM